MSLLQFSERQLLRTLHLPVVNPARVVLRQSRGGNPLDFSGVLMLEPEPHLPQPPPSPPAKRSQTAIGRSGFCYHR